MKKIIVTNEKIFRVYKAIDRKRYHSHGFKDFPPTVSGKRWALYREEDFENIILSLTEYITDKRVKIIEIIFRFCLPAGCECIWTPIALLA